MDFLGFSDSQLDPFSNLPIELAEQNNVFLIDWLSVTFHGLKTWDVQSILGIENLPWNLERTFVNGYPLDLCCGHIHIRHGADNPIYYDNPSKVNLDMGISLDMSGQGCREFETYSSKNWVELITDIFRCGGVAGARCNITRLDIAYDDHIGLIDIWRLKDDIEDCNYISKSRKNMIIRSYDMDSEIVGLTLEVGSKKSDVLIRIYDKAAERGYKKEKHWIRVELQLRHDRASVALQKIYQKELVGVVASGILRNYCMFVTPTADTNRSRWPIAGYWERVLINMEKIRLWISAGEEYNFSKTENHLVLQYGQVMQVIYQLSKGDLSGFYQKCCEAHTELKPKYARVLEFDAYNKRLAYEERKKQEEELSLIRNRLGFSNPDQLFDKFTELVQSDFAELLAPDPNLPFGD